MATITPTHGETNHTHHSLAVNIQRLIVLVEFPRPVLLVPPVLHERGEGPQLCPAHEQLLGAAERSVTAAAVAANIRAKVSVTCVDYE